MLPCAPTALLGGSPMSRFGPTTDRRIKFVRQEFDAGDLSVLIIDPVAIYNADIFQRLMLFQESLSNDRRVIVTLPPFDIPPRLLHLRAALFDRATPYFNDYFPRLRLRAFAVCPRMSSLERGRQ